MCHIVLFFFLLTLCASTRIRSALQPKDTCFLPVCAAHSSLKSHIKNHLKIGSMHCRASKGALTHSCHWPLVELSVVSICQSQLGTCHALQLHLLHWSEVHRCLPCTHADITMDYFDFLQPGNTTSRTQHKAGHTLQLLMISHQQLSQYTASGRDATHANRHLIVKGCLLQMQELYAVVQGWSAERQQHARQ